jgi:hypothetical protein
MNLAEVNDVWLLKELICTTLLQETSAIFQLTQIAGSYKPDHTKKTERSIPLLPSLKIPNNTSNNIVINPSVHRKQGNQGEEKEREIPNVTFQNHSAHRPARSGGSVADSRRKGTIFWGGGAFFSREIVGGVAKPRVAAASFYLLLPSW